jgi:hypothetical protein
VFNAEYDVLIRGIVTSPAGLDKAEETCYFYIRFFFRTDEIPDAGRLTFGDIDMKNMIFVVLVFLLIPNLASAELSQSAARWNLVQKAGGFTAGVMSGLAFHELGHHAVAKAEGIDIDWADDSWWVDSASDSQYRNISIAGFGAQILSTEVILRSESIPKGNSYVLGWLTFNILNQIAYPLRNELSSDGFGDLGTYEKYGGNVEVLEAGLIAHAIWSWYRLKNNPDTPIFIRATSDEVRIGLGWKF